MPVLRYLRGRLALWGGTAFALGMLALAVVVGAWLASLLGARVRLGTDWFRATFALLGFGFLALVLDLVVLYNVLRPPRTLGWRSLEHARVVVGLTAYDDEASIGDAVQEFRAHPRVAEVVVVDNNSKDRTAAVARDAGAVVVAESKQGFGWACRKALAEAASRGDVAVLVEGDGTFDA